MKKSRIVFKKSISGVSAILASILLILPASPCLAAGPGESLTDNAIGTGNGSIAEGQTGSAAGGSINDGQAGNAAGGSTADAQAGNAAGGSDANAQAGNAAGGSTADGQAGNVMGGNINDGQAGSAAGLRAVSEEEILAYYQNTVLIGDSIMLGFRNYAMKSADPMLRELNFLTAGSYGVNNALTQSSAHPLYQGMRRFIWESVQLMGAKRVFICFGLNDLNISKDNTTALYQQVIQNIKSLSPDAEINIMSMTYVLRGKASGRLNNNYIRSFNQSLMQMAAANGWNYIDFANPLADENGDLAKANCSDNFVHLTNNAYAIWTNILRAHAAEVLGSGSISNGENAGGKTGADGMTGNGMAAGEINENGDLTNGMGMAANGETEGAQTAETQPDSEQAGGLRQEGGDGPAAKLAASN